MYQASGIDVEIIPWTFCSICRSRAWGLGRSYSKFAPPCCFFVHLNIKVQKLTLLLLLIVDPNGWLNEMSTDTFSIAQDQLAQLYHPNSLRDMERGLRHWRPYLTTLYVQSLMIVWQPATLWFHLWAGSLSLVKAKSWRRFPLPVLTHQLYWFDRRSNNIQCSWFIRPTRWRHCILPLGLWWWFNM